MSWAARIVAVGTTLSVVACAAIAGLDDPTAVDESNASSSGGSGRSGSGSSGGSNGGTSGSSSGSVQDTGTSSSSGGTSGDASNDVTTAPDAPVCNMLQNGDTCTQSSQCCSTKCNEKRQCVNDCKGSGMFNCNPLSDSECCVGLWCNTGSCSPCIVSGQPAAQVANVAQAKSCCSRQLQNVVGPNCQ